MAPPSNVRRARRDIDLPRVSETSRSSVQKPSKSIACHRCHTRKVRCSGGQPCTNCRQANIETECSYPDRDRQISLSEKYLKEVLEENRLLRSSTHVSNPPISPSALPTASSNLPQPGPLADVAEDDSAVQNPLFESRPWFLRVASLNMPIHIAEAADAAYATRLRQTILNESTVHFPRMSYVSDERIAALGEETDADFRWPTMARARFLVEVALSTVCKCYHVVLRSEVMAGVERSVRDLAACDRIEVCRLLLLFALGEVYSTKTAVGPDEKKYPGLKFFARARKLSSVAAERPRVATMEVCLLQSIYSFALNRRHSAYSFASASVRLGVTMGLQLNVPGDQLRDKKLREHRNRLFWTAYTLDRTWASKLGHPVSIQDFDIHVDAPTTLPQGLDNPDDFGDHEYILHSIGLCRLAERIISSLYSRRKQQGHFAQRVQSILKDLTKWLDSLPDQLRLDNETSSMSSQKELVYLHLRFNQCVIIATRPVLLNVLRTKIHPQQADSTMQNINTAAADSARTIAETCIRCARHSNRLLTNAWVESSFAIFDYFNTQFLFSSSCILAVSSLFGNKDSADDADKFQVAVELLDQLCETGNFGAKEFALHARAIKSTIEEDRAKKLAESSANEASILTPTSVQDTRPPAFGGLTGGGADITAGMALAEPSLQEFLAQPDFDLQFLDAPAFMGAENPYGPELWGNGWSSAC